uniref:Dystrobrevin alpha n=1 Tax=Bursaphelenchus xylophilus TaxID=6326 RepID=A0A1I7SN14_BURXY
MGKERPEGARDAQLPQLKNRGGIYKRRGRCSVFTRFLESTNLATITASEYAVFRGAVTVPAAGSSGSVGSQALPTLRHWCHQLERRLGGPPARPAHLDQGALLRELVAQVGDLRNIVEQVLGRLPAQPAPPAVQPDQPLQPAVQPASPRIAESASMRKAPPWRSSALQFLFSGFRPQLLYFWFALKIKLLFNWRLIMAEVSDQFCSACSRPESSPSNRIRR